MNFTFLPTTEEAALIMLGAKLWNQDNVRDLLSVLDFQSTDRVIKRKWQEIEDKVREEIPKLGLPTCIERVLNDIVKPLGLQIMAWQRIHMDDFGLQLPSHFFWTLQGTIDYKRTAERLVKDENIDIFKRYKLACNYCLEEDISMLWSRLPETLKNDLCNEASEEFAVHGEIVIYWSDILKEEMCSGIPAPIGIRTSELISCLSAFQYAALESVNIVATEYFFRKLTPAERDACLVETTFKVLYETGRSVFESSLYFEANPQILFFLLSQMNDRQRHAIFVKFAFEILACYLEWPMQSLYFETAINLLNFLNGEEYFFTLLTIVNKVDSGLTDYNYMELLEKCWQYSPHRFKSLLKDIFGDEFSPVQLCGWNDYEKN